MDPHSARRRFGANLHHHRKRAGISQLELEHRADVSRTQIGLLERGRRDPRLITVVKLAHGVEVKAATLLDGID